MSSKDVRALNRIVYLSVKVGNLREQSDEVNRLLKTVEAARRAIVTYKLIASAIAAPTPLGVALAAVASISFASDLGGAV